MGLLGNILAAPFEIVESVSGGIAEVIEDVLEDI